MSHKLTIEQKQQLIDMTTFILPKDYHITVLGEKVYINEESNPVIAESIHWYQFAVTELAEKLYMRKDMRPAILTNNMSAFASRIVILKVHPIDALYGIFKTL